MARLAIRGVHYSGDKWYYTSPYLPDGLVIVEGSNGSGKTTFSDLIYHGLGGLVSKFGANEKERHKEIVSDSNNYVQLVLEISGSKYQVRRGIGSNEVAVYSPNGDVIVYPIYRSKENISIYSDWLMGALGFEPVTLFCGTKSGKINITDLLRLVYHDQKLDPSPIYKTPDNENFVTDSQEFRRAIFQILVGKESQEYYSAYAEFRKLERTYDERRGSLAEFERMLSSTMKGPEINITFLNDKLGEKREQLKRLMNYRKASREARCVVSAEPTVRERYQGELSELEERLRELQQSRGRLLDEKATIRNLIETLIVEASQIQKILHFHNELKLFAPNSCPVCLREVKRERGQCVCGAAVDEMDYERFFYSDDEYLEIVKSKQKSKVTAELAVKACEEELQQTIANQELVSAKINKLRQKLVDASASQSEGTPDIDDQILELRVEISGLEQRYHMELERQSLSDSLQMVETELNRSRSITAELSAKSQLAIHERLIEFNKIYNKLMIQTVPNCHRAALDEKYMPFVNDHEYREASIQVPRRLLYYLTLLWLSIEHEDVRFPRFLLIDTPDTAGIDEPYLKETIKAIGSLPKTEGLSPYQIILTTAVQLYPAEFGGCVVQTLKEKLLMPRPKSQS